MNFLQIKSEIPSVAPDIVFKILGWPISNSFLMSFFITIILCVICFSLHKLLKNENSKFVIFMEMVYELVESFLKKLGGSEKQAKFIVPFSASIFFFLVFSNTILTIPGLSSITYNEIPIFRTPTSDFNTTFGLALGMIFIINLVSLFDYGFFGYVGKFIQIKEVVLGFKNGLKDGMMALVNFGIGLLDIISELAKIISLSLRLFGNIYAGEVLIVVLFGALAYVIPSVWMTMSLVFGLVQAVVFSSLVTVYYAQSRKPEQ